jgi:hypothetical protein
MPIGEAATGAIIAGAAQVATTAGNAYATGRMNKKNRAFASEMYDKQRQAALDDYAMTNEYNSPRAQMQRFQEAGLNKNLIYGHTSDAPAVRSTPNAEWHGTAAQADPGAAGEIISQYFRNNQQSAQTDLVATQQRNIDAETNLKEAQRLAVLAGVDLTKFNLEFKQKMESTSAAIMEHQAQLTGANIDKTVAATQFTKDQNERAKSITTQTILESNTRIAKMQMDMSKTPLEKQELQAKINYLNSQNVLQKLEINLREKGINPNDPAWQRQLGQLLDKPLDQIKEWIDGLMSKPTNNASGSYPKQSNRAKF